MSPAEAHPAAQWPEARMALRQQEEQPAARLVEREEQLAVHQAAVRGWYAAVPRHLLEEPRVVRPAAPLREASSPTSSGLYTVQMNREQKVVAIGAASGVAVMLLLVAVIAYFLPDIRILDTYEERMRFALIANVFAIIPFFI